MRKSPLSMFDPLSKVTNLQDNHILHNGYLFFLFTILSIINITIDLFYFRECNINSKSNSFGKEQATFVSVVSIYFTSV